MFGITRSYFRSVSREQEIEMLRPSIKFKRWDPAEELETETARVVFLIATLDEGADFAHAIDAVERSRNMHGAAGRESLPDEDVRRVFCESASPRMTHAWRALEAMGYRVMAQPRIHA
jgi:DNA-binding phage protein